MLAAVSLFIFMGAMFEQSGIAQRLFDAIHMWTRRIPGGLGIGTILMCVVFAATSGIIGATESIVGLLAIPAMMRYRYDKSLICNTICAGGSLGTIIPPSVPAIVIGPAANTSVGDILVGMIVPGLLLAASYVGYIFLRCLVRPADGPRLMPAQDQPRLAQKLLLTVEVLVPPIIIIVAVLGSIMTGIATPTEAAAVGGLGTLLLTLAYHRLTAAVLWDSLLRTVRVSTMILTIIMAGSMFAAVFAITGGMAAIQSVLAAAEIGRYGALALVMLVAFLAGFMLDPLVVILIIVPIAAPIMKVMGTDLVWFSVIFLTVLQTAYLTPPMAPSIFYLRGIAPPEITIRHMYRGIWPFIALQVAVTAAVIAFPPLVLWLPQAMR